MITKNTVLILGAGASKPYGFPTGQELREKIIREGGSRLGGLNQGSWRQEDYRLNGEKFAATFDKSGVTSIDRFLNMQTEDYVIFGKILIMAFIRDYEKHSKFNEHIKNPNQDWYRVFWNKINSGVEKFEDLSFDNFQIISFNYDRSFEYYLYQSVRNLFPKSIIQDKLVIALMKTLKVIHVFGRVESMIWENGESFDEDNVLRYYNNLHFDYNELLARRETINIINEVKKDTSEYKEIIESSKEVFFLGFGFLEENMKLLGAPFKQQIGNHTKFIATAYQISQENINRLFAKYFSAASISNSIFYDCDCAALLRNHLD